MNTGLLGRVERDGVTNVTALRWMTRRLLGNPGGLSSITKVEAYSKSQGVAVGRETLYELLPTLKTPVSFGPFRWQRSLRSGDR